MKKIFILSAICMMACALAAQKPAKRVDEATLDAEHIDYWIGTGSHSVVLAINWADTCLAWGYRFEADSLTVKEVIDAIDQRDGRLSAVSQDMGWGLMLTDIRYRVSATEEWHLSQVLVGGYDAYWHLKLNGTGASLGYAVAKVGDGDFIKFGDNATGYYVEETYDYIFYDEVTPAEPYDAVIAAADIRYWTGTGSHAVVVAVNWADTCLAWGVRFDDDAITVDSALQIIAQGDSRFVASSYLAGGYKMLGNITFTSNDGVQHDNPTSGNWWSTLNGGTSNGLQQLLTDGDFFKWGDYAIGLGYHYTDYGGVRYPDYMSFDAPVLAARGPFCDSVGTAGTTAIAANDRRIQLWADACTVERGPQDIAQAGSAAVSYGNDRDATGTVSMTDNLSVVSLGDGGRAICSFERLAITNGEGPDFAVYENSFDDNFLELAFVEVSSDGTTYVRFPATSLTRTFEQTGTNGSTDPTFINNLAGKYRNGYGTPFDLEELRDSMNVVPGFSIEEIHFVRIVDVVGTIDPRYATRDAFGHIVNDPYPTPFVSGGFDLAGVGVINATPIGAIDGVEGNDAISLYPNPAREQVSCHAAHTTATHADLYNLHGTRIDSQPIQSGSATFRLSGLPAGVYMLRIGATAQKLVVR